MHKREFNSYVNHKDSEQPVHPCSLVNVFAVHTQFVWKSTGIKLRSKVDKIDSQTGLSVCFH